MSSNFFHHRFLLPALLATVAIFGAHSPAFAIEFHETIDAARKASEQDLPVVLSFGAPWCGWCRKMTSETFSDKRVEEISTKFLWVKVNIDEQEELAARYKVRGIPVTAVVDANDRLLASRAGFLSPEKLVDFLEQALANPQPPPEQLVDQLLARLGEIDRSSESLTDEDRKTVVGLVELLAKPEREQRKLIVAAFSRSGPAVLSYPCGSLQAWTPQPKPARLPPSATESLREPSFTRPA